ncbi:hypothetical protein [Tenacibaculum geojense]|uniref:Uncharacterized protein n=1 Tax=Tenacibaculum geojense TaxID=915352 RepID=A0ABW3JQJ2_9FLAO
MKTQTKSIIIGGLFGGISYALGMAGFEFVDGENFQIWKFIFHASFFGIFMGFLVNYNLRKQKGKENKKTE